MVFQIGWKKRGIGYDLYRISSNNSPGALNFSINPNEVYRKRWKNSCFPISGSGNFYSKDLLNFKGIRGFRNKKSNPEKEGMGVLNRGNTVISKLFKFIKFSCHRVGYFRIWRITSGWAVGFFHGTKK